MPLSSILGMAASLLNKNLSTGIMSKSESNCSNTYKRLNTKFRMIKALWSVAYLRNLKTAFTQGQNYANLWGMKVYFIGYLAVLGFFWTACSSPSVLEGDSAYVAQIKMERLLKDKHYASAEMSWQLSLLLFKCCSFCPSGRACTSLS